LQLYVIKVNAGFWGQVDNERIRERGEVNAFFNAEKEAEAARLALKRKIAQSAEAEIAPRGLPAKLQIKPDDPENVVSCVKTVFKLEILKYL
jgi:hypothetical protein